MMRSGWMRRAGQGVWLGFAGALSLAINVPASAQLSTVDPNGASEREAGSDAGGNWSGQPDGLTYPPEDGTLPALPAEPYPPNGVPSPAASGSVAGPRSGTTYRQDDLIGAAEGVFGKGAEGLAKMIEDLLKKQGEPNGYIVGREAGGAFVVGVRYGSGTLYHKVEGQRPVYWTGPSVGFDAGANAGNTFVLVYNLHDSEDLYRRFPAGEGQAYLVGGLHASYLRSGDLVLIPIRMGVGLRLGVNAGYMKFTHKQKWMPF
jgi:hypothetical protein